LFVDYDDYRQQMLYVRKMRAEGMERRIDSKAFGIFFV
jgi:hypothetical protein